MYNEEVLKYSHRYSANNRELLNRSTKCGCFYCLKVFSPSEIDEWIAETEDGEEVTALCPYCGIDSVLPENSEYSINKEFLTEMNSMWF